MHKTQKCFHIKDLSEIAIGAVLLAFPVALSEDAWNLGNNLPVLNTIVIVALSLAFTAWFSYHAHYQSKLDTHGSEFLLRVAVTYSITLVISALILAVLDQFPLWSDSAAAIKRMIIVAAPASAAATVVDSLR